TVQVLNPGNQNSNQFAFIVQATPATAPDITRVSPSSPVATCGPQTFTVIGTNFATGASVTLRDLTTGETFLNRPVSSLSPTQIRSAERRGAKARTHSWTVQVQNPENQKSNQFSFTVQPTTAATPQITR